MNIKQIAKIVDREEVINFVPNSLSWLTETKTIKDKHGNKLKTEFLLDIIHTIRAKCNRVKDDPEKIMEGFPLHSKHLMRNYHNDYKFYMNYLIDNNILVLTQKHLKGRNSTKYRLNLIYVDENYTYYHNRHRKIVEKKKERDLRSLTDPDLSSIDIEVRSHLFSDLFRFEVDASQAKLTLDRLMEKEEINAEKRKVNTQTYEAINAKCLDYTFDSHGRFHSNFTRLKKEIRENCLRVEYKGKQEETFEVDIKNSQPMLLLLLLRKNLSELDLEEFEEYKNECHTGDIYKRLIRMYEFGHSGKTITRKCAKGLFYKYLFGMGNNKSVSTKLFKKMFPSINRWLKSYKRENGYKTVSHELQRLESDLIYNNIIKEIKEIHPDIPIITVHDSLIVPKSCKLIVENVFYKHVNDVFEDVVEISF